MQARLTGIAGEISRLKKGYKKDLIRPANTALRRAAMAALKSFAAGTPVWSGEAVRNYRVGIGAPPAGYRAPVGGTVSWPGGPFPDNVKNEARRGANQAAMLAGAKGALKWTNQGQKLSGTIFIKNTIPMNKASLIESGSAPTPQKSRYPGGLTPRARQAAMSAAQGLLK